MKTSGGTEELRPTEILTCEAQYGAFYMVGATAASEKHHFGHNEDNWFIDPEHGSLGVFDGVGGAAGSEWASELAAEMAQEGLARIPEDIASDIVGLHVAHILRQTNTTLWETGKIIQTTATIAKILHDEVGDQYAAIASVGDSRAYRQRGGRLEMLTLDHEIDARSDGARKMLRFYQEKLSEIDRPDALESVPSALAWDLADEYRRRATNSSILGGPSGTLHTAIVKAYLQPDDALLLSTDGIHDNLTNTEISEVLLRGTDHGTMAGRVVEAAKMRSRDSEHVRSKPDDMTVVIARSVA